MLSEYVLGKTHACSWESPTFDIAIWSPSENGNPNITIEELKLLSSFKKHATFTEWGARADMFMYLFAFSSEQNRRKVQKLLDSFGVKRKSQTNEP